MAIDDMKSKGTGSVLVTGAAGFLGSWVCSELLSSTGHRVVGLDDLSGGFESNVRRWRELDPSRSAFVRGSITNKELVDEVFGEEEFLHVYHLAAYAAEGLSPFIRRFNYENNVIGSIHLINASIESGSVECFVFTSSIAVYGSESPPFDELTPPNPIDPYGIAKLAIEMDLRAAKQTHGLDFVIFRPHNVFGEFQNMADPFRNVVGIFANQALSGKPMTIFGDGTQTRAFSYVGEVARCIARSVQYPDARNETFNIGGEEVASVAELAQMIGRAVGGTTEVRHLPARHEAEHAHSLHDKATRILGFRPQVDLRSGIERTIAWARSIGPQVPRTRMVPEVSKGIPPSWIPYLVGSS